jgi:peptidyl-prolyl cis-trans isomerase C
MASLRFIVLAAILAILIRATVLAQVPPAPGAPVAIVNGEPITAAELEDVMRLGPTGSPPPTQVQRQQLQSEALTLLIDDLVVQQFLRRTCPPVEPKEVAQRMGDMKRALAAQRKTLEDFYRDSGQTEQRLRTNIVNMLQWAEYVKAHLSDADALRYYNDNRDFFDQVMVQASHIVFRVSATAPTEEREKARARLQALRQDILAGKIDFAEAAKKYSQCPSAPRGGDIGFFPRKWAVEENFARAAFSLPTGGISDIVETEYGFHVIKATNRKAGTPSSYEKIKQEVREIAAEELRQNLIAEQRRAAKIVVNIPTASSLSPRGAGQDQSKP